MKTTARLSGMKQVADYLSANADEGDNVVTIRPSATALFGIDSDDRYENYLIRRSNPTYPFRFNIQKNESLLNGFFKRLALTEFRLNWTLPNLSSAWGNNVMTLWYSTNPGVSSSSTTIIVPDGFYDINDIAVELQNQIQSQTGLSNFLVTTNTTNDFSITFKPPTSYSIFFQNQGTAERELVDMLNVPNVTSFTGVQPPLGLYSTIIQSGVPNMRATDYMDIVCSQLSYNQNLKDSTSSKVSRDMIARIYLDDTTSSSAIVQTNNYSNTALSFALSGTPTQVGNVVTFTTATNTGLFVGAVATIKGITGANDVNWNEQVTIIQIPTTTSVVVEYGQAPTGTPVMSGTPTINSFGSSGFSTPTTAWDNKVNGVTPFVIYRQFPYPKQIRWNEKMPIGNVTFELFDDQGRSIQDLWNEAYPTTTPFGFNFANSFTWNCSLLVSED